VENSIWFASDFMVGAGMVIFQAGTGRVVLLQNADNGRWFLPKGRKDVGESLEQAVLREAYEESGFRVELLPLFTPMNQPGVPGSAHTKYHLPNTEPIFISTSYWPPRKRAAARAADKGGEYLIYWFVGQIAEDAKPTMNTQMEDEESYITHIMDIEDALRVLEEAGATITHHIVATASHLWQESNDIAAEEEGSTHAASVGDADISSSQSSSPSSLAHSPPTPA